MTEDGNSGSSGGESDPKRGTGEGAKRPRSRAGSSTLDPLVGRVCLDRFEIQRRIGSGGMGAVYRGRQTTVDRPVALKVLRADLVHQDHIRQRFEREAQIIARLKHPNTVHLIEYGETEDGLIIMVMELLEGASLSERLKSSGPLKLEETLRLGAQVASSLAEAHLLGLVHRDLKPANIFLTEVGHEVHAKVLDFGIARIMDEESTRLTSTGQVFGTPRYMSPEQAMSTAEVDARSDLYSLGLILYECLAGQPPFLAQTSLQYLSAHTTQLPPKLRTKVPHAPVELEGLIDACLAKEPERRPPTADDVGRTLTAIHRALDPAVQAAPIVIPRGEVPVSSPSQAPAEKTSVLTKPPTSTPSSSEDSRRLTPTMIGIIAGLVLGLGALAARFWVQPPVEIERIDPTSLVDAAVVMAPKDAGVQVTPDAGLHAPDAGMAKKDAGSRTRPRRKPRPKPRPKPKPTKTTPGSGTTQGPARFTIQMGDDDGPDLLRLAQKCSSSSLTGLSKLTVKRCPKQCAILVDQLCAGRTPAVDREVSQGFRNVAVVCGGKVRLKKRVRFRDERTTVIRCP